MRRRIPICFCFDCCVVLGSSDGLFSFFFFFCQCVSVLSWFKKKIKWVWEVGTNGGVGWRMGGGGGWTDKNRKYAVASLFVAIFWSCLVTGNAAILLLYCCVLFNCNAFLFLLCLVFIRASVLWFFVESYGRKRIWKLLEKGVRMCRMLFKLRGCTLPYVLPRSLGRKVYSRPGVLQLITAPSSLTPPPPQTHTFHLLHKYQV